MTWSSLTTRSSYTDNDRQAQSNALKAWYLWQDTNSVDPSSASGKSHNNQHRGGRIDTGMVIV